MIDFFKNHKFKFILGSKGLLVFVFLTAMLSLIAVEALKYKTNDLLTQCKVIQSHITKINSDNVYLENKMQNMDTESGIKQIAIEDLDMTFKGAIVFEIVE